MLKALDIIGFKSFADKTRFEFCDGITVIVGPNGSGKSNVVDAIKWVLGAQSAKSLRGKEMADVIFKPSNNSSRRDVNTAEVTMTIDNSTGLLPLESEEVFVTRRVYKSGEGEYLINHEPCRLKDIKDLFRGTGVGTDAYSLIEQGEVKRMLETSNKDRRAIFEEAAGISRFKAKKIDSQRKLERVELNLTRLSDIVDEVESRLRAVRNQASKARRYREYTDRLQQLRTQIGLVDWKKYSQQLEHLESELSAIQSQMDEATARVEDQQKQSTAIDEQLQGCSRDIMESEANSSTYREQVASLATTLTQQIERSDDIRQEVARYRLQLATVNHRAGGMKLRLAESRKELDQSESRFNKTRGELSAVEEQLGSIQLEIERFREQSRDTRQQQISTTHQSAETANRMASLKTQYEKLGESVVRMQQAFSRIEKERNDIQSDFDSLEKVETTIQQQISEKQVLLDAIERDLGESRRLLSRRKDDISNLQNRLGAIKERTSVLEELERNRDGIHPVVQDLLSVPSEESSDPSFNSMPDHSDMDCTLIADVITAPIESAIAIDLILGPRSHFVFSPDDELIPLINSKLTSDLKGRVGIVTRQAIEKLAEPDIDLSSHKGVICCASKLVQADPQFKSVVDQFLGFTWFVEDLETARMLSSQYAGALQFITKHNELVDFQGNVILGSEDSATGLISRRSELRQLQQQQYILDVQIRENQQEVQRLTNNVHQEEIRTKRVADTIQGLNEQLVEHRVKTETQRQRLKQLQQQSTDQDSEIRSERARQHKTQSELRENEQIKQTLDTELHRLDQKLEQADHDIADLEHQRHEHQRTATALQIDLGTVDQRRTALREQLRQFQEDHHERTQTISQHEQQLAEADYRLRESVMHALHASARLSEKYLQKQKARCNTLTLHKRQQKLTDDRQTIQLSIDELNKQQNEHTSQKHAWELEAGELRLQRNQLKDRFLEDYNINIEVQKPITSGEEGTDSDVEQEIEGLRRKINNIGAVNMEALEELTDLEDRFEGLSTRFKDIQQSKTNLEKIIESIDADSRRLFVETLDQIRLNFQTLYRKAFGGGQADILLEEGVDVLEAGVEITASPPGKAAINLSLLSGGEKALTAVSLILAMFQFRPSPFCVLDEVDAPFDEANIGRFINVLKDFLDDTRFILVTHSKKTMTAADLIYGVTMQESGVSKQVNVRFEDVDEQGNFSEDVLKRNKAA